jgi:hypothetical protein
LRIKPLTTAIHHVSMMHNLQQLDHCTTLMLV